MSEAPKRRWQVFTEEDGFMLMNPANPKDRPWRVITIDQANDRIGRLVAALEVYRGRRRGRNADRVLAMWEELRLRKFDGDEEADDAG